MYRFLKVRGFTLTNRNLIRKPAYMQSSSYLCSFCKFYHAQIPKLVYQEVKYYSTTINTVQLSDRNDKKKKRKNVNYVELLEVTESKTTNTKAKVKKLNASNLSTFVDLNSPVKRKVRASREQMLQELNSARKSLVTPKTKKKEEVKTVNNSPEVSEISRTPLKTDKVSYSKRKKMKCDPSLSNSLSKSSNFIDATDNLQADSLGLVNKLTNNNYQLEYLDTEEIFEDDEELDFNSGNKNTEKPVKKTKHDLLYEENMKALNEKSKKEHQIQYLLSYFDACSKSGNFKQALQILFHFRERKYWQLKNALKEICFYNFFLRECASTGDLKNVKRLSKIIKDDSLQMTPESFAYIFECVGRAEKTSEEIDFLKTMKEQMDKSQICFNDILIKPILVRDKLEKILQAVRLLEPNFEPVFEKLDVGYDCKLLENVFENGRLESPAKGLFSYSDLEERAKRQFDIEIQGHVEIKSVATREEPNEEILAARQKVGELETNWRNEARKAFDRNYEALKMREKSLSTSHLHPFLFVLDKEECINSIIREIKNLGENAESFSPSLNYLEKQLGLHLYMKYNEKVQKDEGVIDNTLACYAKYCKWYLEGGKEKNGRIRWQLVENEMSKTGNSLTHNVLYWPSNVFKSVGKFLYNIILNDMKINVSVTKGKDMYVPAFYVVLRSKYKYLKEEIKPHPGVTKLYRDSQPEFLNFEATFVPTLSPPRPWSCYQNGGYLIKKTNIIRVPFGGGQYKKKLDEIPKKQIYPALDCLNQLGTIPWKVNISILDVAVKIFQDGGSLKLNVPQPTSVLPAVPLVTEDLNEEERLSVSKMRMELKRKKNEMYSLWCDTLYKLSLANHYKDEIFWLPHNMDFRGRVYPIPPHLSQMGSDFARSLLVFAQKKPLGPKGLDWLKIHVINLTGFQKKESLQRRLEYANEILDDILESAANPLTGKMWWATSDEPWQTLSACMEIAQALNSPNPEEYLTGLPVHQDGSCNGLQHYAALGRDQIGAESVNLYPFDKPHDVYSDVVVLVENTRKLDAQNGVEIAQTLEGFIQRKVIKQTIMTTVYGVTKFGAKLQIVKQLKDVPDFPQDKVWEASGYLVQKTFESLRSMFTSAKEIQDWFTECAKFICGVTEQSVEWVTPLGLPVIQPYTKLKTSGVIHNPGCHSYEKPNIMKQKNAFPPNFIHSLDSTHMMLTSLYCEQAGITFMSVHDCFWTHPCSVEIMNKICRKQFISLHSLPILENLSKSFMDTYAFSESELNSSESTKILDIRRNLNNTLTRVPAKGTFDLENVQFSKYFFS